MGNRAPAIALVDPSEPGNVGTAARAMANFGFEDLLLVDPPPLDPDGPAYGFAGRARETILPDAAELTAESLTSSYHTVGFTSTPNEDATSHVRFPVHTPAELATALDGLEADIALVFGRERTGLTNDELATMDRICTIPASGEYPALNLGQAVTIALYELQGLSSSADQLPEQRHHRADEAAIERLHDRYAALLAAINHPPEKRAKAGRLFRRVIGRADPTNREVTTLTGICRRAAEFAEPPGEDE